MVNPMPRTLKIGSKGKAVRRLQQLLGGLNVDGDFRKETEAAVIMFQEYHGLEADGVAGSDVWNLLLAPAPPPIPQPDDPGVPSGGSTASKSNWRVWAAAGVIAALLAVLWGYS